MIGMPTYLLVEKEARVTHTLTPGVNRIGRNPTNDIRLRHTSVSSFHCEVYVSGRVIRLRDLNSTNGTWLDGRMVSDSCVRPGQVIDLGGLQLVFEEREFVGIPAQSPKLSKRRGPIYRKDGTPACSVNPDKPADFECRQCERFFSEKSVRVVGRSEGEGLTFGQGCRGPCDLARIGRPEPKPDMRFFGKITETIRFIRGR